MTEFEYFVMIAWSNYTPTTYGENIVKDIPRILDKKKFAWNQFPTEEERLEFAKETKADYITIEKRYEYGDLPFE